MAKSKPTDVTGRVREQLAEQAAADMNDRAA